jgi:hypothetical protein
MVISRGSGQPPEWDDPVVLVGVFGALGGHDQGNPRRLKHTPRIGV